MTENNEVEVVFMQTMIGIFDTSIITLPYTFCFLLLASVPAFSSRSEG